MGWLGYGASPSTLIVEADGTYTIEPYETTGPGPRALKVAKEVDSVSGGTTWYYLEYRQPLGFDSGLTTYFDANLVEGTFVL